MDLVFDMNGKSPRTYQLDIIGKARELVAKGTRSFIIAAPTGSGKNFCACILMKLAVEKGKSVVFVAPLREAIKRASSDLQDCGVSRHGMILSGEDEIEAAMIQVASKDTLASRVIRRKRRKLPPCDLLIIDECRSVMATEYRKLINKFRDQNPSVVVIGLDATPCRSDGRGLNDVFDDIINLTSYDQLIQDGYLVPVSAMGWEPRDMSDVKGLSDSKWEQVAAERHDNKRIVGDVVEHWTEYGKGRSTIVFTSRIAHSIHLRDQFRAQGVVAEHLDGEMELSERENILTRFHDREVEVIVNVDVLSQSYDEPLVSCIVLAAPTKSLVKFRQRSGRALRPCPEIAKDDCLILDHACSISMFGFPDEDVEWTLEKTRNIQRDYMDKRSKGELKKEPMRCEKCNTMFVGRKSCPNCGTRRVRPAREMAVRQGYLRPLKRKHVALASDATYSQKEAQWHKSLAVMANKGLTFGAAAQMYKRAVGEMPWETKGLPNMPKRHQWKQRVTGVYPQYIRKRVGT